MFKIKKQSTGKITYWIFNKIGLTFRSYIWWDFWKSHGAYWIDLPFLEIKIKRNYKGHSIY